MAKIIEPERQQDNQEENEQQLDMFAQVEEQQETPEPQEPEIPDKYKGKSAEELVQMHQEAEKLLGRQSSEVGELRKVVDTYIQTQLTEDTKEAPQQDEEAVLEFYNSLPNGAVIINNGIFNSNSPYIIKGWGGGS